MGEHLSSSTTRSHGAGRDDRAAAAAETTSGKTAPESQKAGAAGPRSGVYWPSDWNAVGHDDKSGTDAGGDDQRDGRLTRGQVPRGPAGPAARAPAPVNASKFVGELLRLDLPSARKPGFFCVNRIGRAVIVGLALAGVAALLIKAGYAIAAALAQVR
jgi:hypothetical protein